MNNNSFWKNKPVKVSNDNAILNSLLSKDVLLSNINKEINLNRFKLEYSVIMGDDLDRNKTVQILNFINKNYVTSKEMSRLLYSIELFEFYCQTHQCIILEFYPKNNKNIVGYIIGKIGKVSLYNVIFETSEVNFLCIVPHLRSMGLSSYMINVLSKEIITKYDIITSHYTVSTPIQSPYFGEKLFFHRVKSKKSTFNCDKKFINTHTIEYINNKQNINQLIYYLYNEYLRYCQLNYDIYEVVNIEEFKTSFMNKAFHHFIIRDDTNFIIAYVSFFRLDTLYNETDIIRNGYYYYMFFNDIKNKINCIEYIHKYIYDKGIFNLITFTDIFDINYEDINCVKSDTVLKYYFYNLNCPLIQNNKNGLITI